MDRKNTIKEVIKELQNKKLPSEIQEVKPVIESINKGMVQCNFDIHPDLKKKLKLKAIEDGNSIKVIITEAIQAYLG